MSEYFLGVDGGQSSTIALIADGSGCVLGSGAAGPCNHVGGPEGRTKFTNAINGSVSLACAEAGLDTGRVRFRSACLGFSGGPEDKQALLVEMIPTDHLTVATDALIALAGATAGAPGIITIAGTGSIAFGRNESGKTARAGGWGYVFGDEGGAFDLTRQALRAALRFEEGWGPATELRAALLEATGADSANELLHRFYTTEYPRPRIAAFSKIVDSAAEAGDAVAREILRGSAQTLALLAAAVRAQLFEAREPARIAFVGGVFRSEIVLEHFRNLVELEDGNIFGPPLYGPAAGALIESYRSLGLNPTLTNVPEFKT